MLQFTNMLLTKKQLIQNTYCIKIITSLIYYTLNILYFILVFSALILFHVSFKILIFFQYNTEQNRLLLFLRDINFMLDINFILL